MSESYFGKYRLVRHLAEGGMATIWLAEQTGPEGFNKELVIKRLLPSLAKDRLFTDMFLDEARLASKLAHPNIGQILELGQLEGDYFIAMEFVDGLSLEAIIDAYDEHGAMAPDLAARLVADVLKALEYAHEATDRHDEPLEIVHRDVTPSNILVSNDGIVKLVDFGVAKAVKHHSQTQTGAVKGKYPYMSPEQIRDEDVGPASDVFSAGITFYEMLTGERPFGSELPAVSRILREETPDPREVNPAIPEQYVRIVEKALAKSTEDRYSTARAMLLDVETTLRMRNSYVDNRELSVLVRSLRGLPLPQRDESVEIEGALFAADRTADNMQFVNRESSKTPPPIVIGVTVATFLGVVVVIAILVVLTTASIPPGSLIVLSDESPAEADSRPEALFVRDGAIVAIETVPEAALFHRGIFIGTTPIQTRLSPGSYKVELTLGETFKRDVIRIEGDEPFYRHRVDLAGLEEGKGQKPRKPEAPKPGILDNIESLLD